MPSNTSVDRAGDFMRQYLQGHRGDASHDVFYGSIGTIRAFRAEHAPPLRRVAAGLRYYVDKHSAGRPIVVGQRLKRFITILDKLQREPRMNLSRMHDVGGCRAVVETDEEVYAIAGHLKRRWEWARDYDYIAKPKPDSGYRAFHLVVKKDRHLIEVQLRTQLQHRWAEIIEVIDRQNPEIELKGGSAPAELVEYYRLGSELLAADERGELADAATIQRFRQLNELVAPYTRRKS